uniref:Transmembrane protein 14C n=1 Tax=Rhabditophanes sp. KR3021 TaxID=114890 RepID=A0AC35U7B8_9BILA
MADIIGIVYGCIVAAGGLIGFLKASSVPSLVFGGLSGAVAIYGGYSNNNHVLCGVSTVLTLFMGMRFMNSGKFMPAGLTTVLSLCILVRCFINYASQRR